MKALPPRSATRSFVPGPNSVQPSFELTIFASINTWIAATSGSRARLNRLLGIPA